MLVNLERGLFISAALQLVSLPCSFCDSDWVRPLSLPVRRSCCKVTNSSRTNSYVSFMLSFLPSMLKQHASVLD
jgi:hypothetical protein